MLDVRLHGVRGSVAVSDPLTERFGGDTTCFEIDAGDPTRHVLIDAGTGIRKLGKASVDGAEFHILLSHVHWDHIAGLAFFPPIFEAGRRVTFYGRPEGMSVREALEGAMRPPWFPLALSDTPSDKAYVDIEVGPFEVGGLAIESSALTHPQGSLAYRFASGGHSVVVATDHEVGDPAVDERLIALARGADVLLHDAQYTADDYDAHVGWGHSTWDAAVAIAVAAEVKQLVMVSHEPDRTDHEIERLLALARQRLPLTVAGYSGMVIRTGV